MKDRIHNFNPGPAALPLPVLEEIQGEFLNFKGSGMSVTEISHRSAAFAEVLNDAVARITRLLSLPENYHVLFLQGGASTQFYQVPMNFLGQGDTADYVDTGTWSSKAIKEVNILGHSVNVAASSEDRNYCYIPKDINFNPDAAYAYIVSNNTIKGTQWAEFPNTRGVPIVSDMSSDILSRPLDVSPFGLIYAGAQKNLGPAGVTLVIIRDDMLDRVPDTLPSMVSYKTHVEKNSSYNTPPCFAVYVVQLVTKWLEETMGGLEGMSRINGEKASLLYNYMDSDDFYLPTADKDSRSKMNVTFRLADEELEAKFVAEGLENGLNGLKGHRSVGGCRASIYNAVPREAVQSLVEFMKEFSRTNG
jgi:phosphoserine aminotransferase